MPYSNARFSEYATPPHTLNLTLASWPVSQITDALGSGWRSNRLELRHMVLDDLGSFDFADNLTELHIHSCNGTVTLAAAQHAMLNNWTTAEHVLGIG